MIFLQPSPTPADLHFQIAGIPVRVHPFFWVAGFLLSGGGTLPSVLIWIAALFVSILIHELGHAVLQRWYGGRPRVVLYMLGGLASAEGVRAGPWGHILICLAGPLAGFALAALLAVGVLLSGVPVLLEFPYLVPGALPNPKLWQLVFSLFQINVLWGLVNLLPVYPLDGGQAARELLTLAMRPATGIAASLWLSTMTAGAIAALFLVYLGSFYGALMFGLLAYNSYQALQAYQASRQGGYR